MQPDRVSTRTRWSLAFLLLLWSTGGMACTTELVEPDCTGPLELVLQGRVGDQAAEAFSPALEGRWLDQRFYLNLADPQQAQELQQATDPRAKSWWVLEFGYNPPTADDQIRLINSNLAKDMQLSNGTTFQVKSHAQLLGGNPGEQLCNPSAGELCGGLGLYRPGSFTPSTDIAGERPYERYLPVRSGTITFTQMTTEEKSGEYDLELDHELDGGQPDGGRLRGCFRAQLSPVSGYRGYVLE